MTFNITSNSNQHMVELNIEGQKFTEAINKVSGIPEEIQKSAIQTGCNLAIDMLADISQNRKTNLNSYQKKLHKVAQEINAHQNIPAPTHTPSNHIDQVNRRLETQDRLRFKLALKNIEKKYQDLVKDLKTGIDTINKQLQFQGIDSTQHTEAVQQLLSEEEKLTHKQLSKGASSKPSRKKKTSNRRGSIKKNTTGVNQTDKSEETSLQTFPLISDKDKLSKFILHLYENSSKCLETPRVRRWKTTDLTKIRSFEDKDGSGQQVQRYCHLSDKELLEQRVRHYLPGTERILKDPSYRNIYAFPTNRGFGVCAQLTYAQETHNGILYFGIDKAHYLFHKYFEYINFRNLPENVFQDRQVEEAQEKEEEAEWDSHTDFSLDASKEGILHFRYADHAIQVFPLRADLFQQKITQIK